THCVDRRQTIRGPRQLPAGARHDPDRRHQCRVALRLHVCAEGRDPYRQRGDARAVIGSSRKLTSAVQCGGEGYERADYAAALKEWLAAAAAGNPDASYRLGLLYARGHGVLANLADAAAWYRRAAEQGHAAAQHQLSLLYLDGYRAHALTGFARWFRGAARRRPPAAPLHPRPPLFPRRATPRHPPPT